MRASPLVLLLALSPGPASATGKNKDIGTAAGQFLMLGADARGAAMGGAMAAAAEDATSIYWNPAGLAGLEYRQATLSHAIYFQSVFHEFIAYAQPVPSILGEDEGRRHRANQFGAVGVSAMYLNGGNMTEVDNTGAETGGNFTPHDLAVTVAWGASITRMLDIGLGLKFVNSAIEESATTGAADLGARFRFRLVNMPAALSLSAHDLGGTLKYLNQADPLPMRAKAGFMLRPFDYWLITSDITWPKDKAAYPAFGTEVRLPTWERSAVFLRAGYSARTSRQALQTLTGISAGAGLQFSWLTIDYSWTPFGVLEDAHRFSFSTRF